MKIPVKPQSLCSLRWLALTLAIWICATAVAQSAPAAANNTATVASAAPPPAAPVKRSAADLEKLVAPIALYPDPVIATLLPASVYPLEIVQAARFVADTNNLAKLDAQPWDANVKAVARIPTVIKQMNDDLTWTQELGEAFLAQDKDVMDAIQAMRNKAQKAGTLQTTPQQIVTVTNMVVEKTVEQQVVVVTNTVVQIQPASSSVVYVPTYNPYTVYYPPPAYVVNPYPLLTFGAGVAVGAIIANNCDWYHGGCYHGGYYGGGGVNINGDVNINRGNINTGNIGSGNRVSNSQKWQPDQNRLSKSGSPTAANSARSAEARGWSSGGTSAATANAGARTSAGTAAARPSTGAASANRSAATPSANRASPSQGGSQPRANPSASRPTPSNSAFGGASSGAGTRDYSNRGASSSRSSAAPSRGGGGFSGGGGSRGGGGRGGGGRR